ncbi:YajQ family cyclic di-GMP-binding protein [Methylolobus aquaticus]|uniref:YajQ family cyclic di-GMP-binding protein n=1 Tax=Methylotetracoccus oryzae TaxID=1919059 RepID=UPI00111921E3|nr:YajQ family cyclic di-GMP-binding protein [Methylotetracoccus oryzae]
MPTFDVVSEVNLHEVNNAVDQANREVTTRFDFKGSGAQFAVEDDTVQLQAESEFQLQQMMDILQAKLAKRGVDIQSLDIQSPEVSGRQARQSVKLKQGIDSVLAKTIVKMVKDSKLKVQASIQGDKVRVSGAKRDDLQAVIALLRKGELSQPLQYENFRD